VVLFLYTQCGTFSIYTVWYFFYIHSVVLFLYTQCGSSSTGIRYYALLHDIVPDM